MRSLHADLTAEQRKASYEPYVIVTLSSRDMATIRIEESAIQSGTNRTESLYENYSEDEAFAGKQISSAQQWGMSFTPLISHYITGVELVLYNEGSSGGTAHLVIYNTDSNGHPTGSFIAHDDDNRVSWGSTWANRDWERFTFSTPVFLTAGVKYAIVLAESGSSPGNFIRWVSDIDAKNYPRGEMLHSLNNGSTWSISSTQDFHFREYGVINRLLSVRTAEGMFGGELYELQGPNGARLPIACDIVLNNADQSLTALDLRGYLVTIGWGLNTDSGYRVSTGEPFKVVSQRNVSRHGISQTILRCISMWQNIEYQKVLGATLDTAAEVYYVDGATIRHDLMDVLTDKPSKVLTWDGSSYTDRTAEATNNSTSDFDLMDATPAVDDAVYIGVADSVAAQFDRISLDIGQAGVKGTSTWSINFQYSRGAGSWGTLQDLDDQTAEFTNAGDGLYVISFTMPTDWASDTVDGTNLRWVRFRVSAYNAGSGETQPFGTRLGINRHWGLQVDDTDGIENNYQPTIATTFQESVKSIVERLITLTECKLVMKEKYFSLDQFDTASPTVQYTYEIEGDHAFLESEHEQGELIPNRVAVVDLGPGEVERGAQAGRPEAGRARFAGTADNAASQARVGIITEFHTDPALTSDATAATVANRILNGYIQKQYQGSVTVPMNVGQEPWDWIEVIDSRANKTYTGRVGHLIREYDAMKGTYRLHIEMGLRRGVAIDRVAVLSQIEQMLVTKEEQPIVAGQGFTQQEVEVAAMEFALRNTRVARQIFALQDRVPPTGLISIDQIQNPFTPEPFGPPTTAVIQEIAGGTPARLTRPPVPTTVSPVAIPRPVTEAFPRPVSQLQERLSIPEEGSFARTKRFIEEELRIPLP